MSGPWPEPDASEPRGIGGWLLIPIINALLLIPALTCRGMWLGFWPAYWNSGGTVAGQGDALLVVIALCIVVSAVHYVVLSPWIYLLVRKHRWFPRASILYLIAFALLNGFCIVLDLKGNETMSGVQNIVFSCIWIYYMRVSVRVRNTFPDGGVK